MSIKCGLDSNVTPKLNNRLPLSHKMGSPSTSVRNEYYFLSRNIPHAKRVCHIKGLNGVPICCVRDEGFFPRQRFELSRIAYPDQELLFRYFLPPNAIGINSTSYPIDTVTGIQTYPCKSKIYPPSVSAPAKWKDELRFLSEKVGGGIQPRKPQTPRKEEEPLKRNLNTPADGLHSVSQSQASSRLSNCCVTRLPRYRYNDAKYKDNEFKVQMKLCEILQSDSLADVQHWLLTASQKEKAYVSHLIRTSLALELFYKQQENFRDTQQHLFDKNGSYSHRLQSAEVDARYR
ncbi:hypothetical protein FKM82_001034 [Ascaphus truei]